jgi:ribosomal protein S12 methylthiotransferase accessory factor
LDGSRTLDDLLEQFGAEISAPEIIFALYQLDNLGLLATDGGANNKALWHALGAEDCVAAGKPCRVQIVSVGPTTDAEPLTAALAVFGIDNGIDGLIVAVTDHYLRPELTWLNESAQASGKPWMLCKLVGRSTWIGPIFRPGTTGCLACLQERLRLNRQAEDFLVRKLNDPQCYETSMAASQETIAVTAAWAAQEIALWLGGRGDRLEGRLLSVSVTAAGLRVDSHVLTRRPQCVVCGDPELARANPHELMRRPIVFAADGGFRTEHPDATLKRLQPHVSPITGVVTWLSDMAHDPEGLFHSYGAGHNFAVGADSVRSLQEGLRSRTGGKGMTAQQARVSAICEAIERYCGVFRGDEPTVRASLDAIRERAIHPHDCLLFSEFQYDHRDQLNADPEQGFFHRVPRRFPENVEIDWTPLRSLSTGQLRYLPTAYCYFAHPDVSRYDYCSADGNGCAAGNTFEEAVLQGLLELVERDSTAIWWYNRVARPAVEIESFKLPYLARVQERYARERRELWVVDLTSDLQIPVFAAISRRIGAPTEDLLLGLGAHLDPSLALIRAVTELNQFLPAVSRTDSRGNTIYRWPDDVAVRFWKRESLETQPQLRPDTKKRPRTQADFVTSVPVDFLACLDHCLAEVSRLGMDIFVLNQSRPDVELSVARVVVPGLRHFWRRLGIGRLYTVPVKLGWLDAPTPEAELNPVSIFF